MTQAKVTMPWGYIENVWVQIYATTISVLTTVVNHQLQAPVAFNTPEAWWIEILRRVRQARKSHQHRELHLGHPVRGLSIY
jgi:hypothetical protein